MQNNPFIKAAQAAWAELSSDDARTFYVNSAWWAAQRAVDDSIITVTVAIWAIAKVAERVHECGAAFGEGFYEGFHGEDDEPLALAPALAPVLALPAVSSAPRHVRRYNSVAPIKRDRPIPAMPLKNYGLPRFYVDVPAVTIGQCQGGARLAGNIA